MNKKGSKHMILAQRNEIEILLKTNTKCKEIAEAIGVDERTVSKEVHLRRIQEENKRYGIYGKKDNLPCKTIERFPFVCNGCNKRSICFKKYKFFYKSSLAQDNYESILSSSREGLDISLEDKEILDAKLAEGTKNGQSIYHIINANKDQIKVSVSTVYRMVNQGNTIVQRLDLRRAVKLKPRKHYLYKEDNKSIRIGRKYVDFLKACAQKPFPLITEMDVVEGPRGQSKCLLTLHITNTHFMLAIVLPDQTKESVTNVFLRLQQELGLDLYKHVFECILTDRGSSFCDPDSIEIDKTTGEKIASVFFCDSYSSYQKGAIEENHTLIRYVLPKKTYFSDLTQEQADTMLSHINSYYRSSLDGTPYELTLALLGEEFIEKTKIRPITPDLVNVTTKLLK